MKAVDGIQKDRISIVITVYNRLNLLRKCLQSILWQSRMPYEVVLSDDGSEEDPLPILREFREKFSGKTRYVRQEHQDFRAARVRNNGVSVCSGDIIVFLDQDIVIPPKYLESILQSLKEGRFLSGYPVRLSKKQTEALLQQDLTRRSFKDLVSTEQYRKIRQQWRKDYFYYITQSLGLPYCKGVKLRSGVSAMHLPDYQRVNGFDESFVGWGNEDDNLGKRLKASGRVGYNFVKDHFPLHLYHEPYHTEGERRNRNHARKKADLITKTSFYCDMGLDARRDDLLVDMGD
ncbi:MAG: glycosyltransferase [Candidatus Cloacimonetes bacterium]|jgi:hypothetical protein|nr:glycosyltransferase [Candidatus Cloacimonadota bacterium]MDD4147816.1 glycosyltransferase [Candidatus Cloacimonadota bacterium]MDD4560004.1 glycosyltransferase [Candidatus Cloacimonadota bacterium]